MKIIAVGDMMPGGVLNRREDEYVCDEIRTLLRSADLRVGTLETAIGNEPTFSNEKMSRRADVIYAEDEDLERIVSLDINIVSLANNHFFDLGEDGARHTIEMLDKLGIKHCGAGMNLPEAAAPAVVEISGRTYAFIGCCDWREKTVGWCPMATNDNPGVNPMTEDNILPQIRACKKRYDFVVVMPHWGIEYQYTPSLEQYSLAKKMIAAGADIIIGGHTHCIQPTCNVSKKPVVFSHGNFLFPDRLIVAPRSTYYTPEKVNFDTIPVTFDYPYVETLTLKRWGEVGRVGQVTEFSLDDEVFTHKEYYIFCKNAMIPGISGVIFFSFAANFP